MAAKRIPAPTEVQVQAEETKSDETNPEVLGTEPTKSFFGLMTWTTNDNGGSQPSQFGSARTDYTEDRKTAEAEIRRKHQGYLEIGITPTDARLFVCEEIPQ